MSKNKTVRECITELRNIFDGVQIESSKIDSELIVEHVLDLDKTRLILNYDALVSDEQCNEIFSLGKRREKKEPIAYILGHKEFMGLEFMLNSDTLVPRPDTEILVEAILKQVDNDSPLKILDMCTGSGCIAISLAKYLKKSNIIAVDVSSNAIEMSKKNSVINEVNDRVDFIVSDLFKELKSDEILFDIIVSNPPYIKTEIIQTLDDDVKLYEPMRALDGGRDGLIFYEKIIQESDKFLKHGGILAFEMDYTYFEVLKEALEDNGYIDIKLYKDIANLDRVIIARRK